MIELRVRYVAALALALALATVAVAPGADARKADVYQIVGGTWVSGWQGNFLGPTWWLDGPTQTYGVTMVGPDGYTKHIGGPNQRLPGMPSTRSLYWCNTTCGEKSPGGDWYAIGDGDHTKVNFSIDQMSRLAPVQVTLYSGDANTFTATWKPELDAQSFIVYVQDEGATSAFDWIVGKILPAGSTTITFNDMGLNLEWGYESNIFAFTGDIVGGATPSVFNIASTRIDFVPGVLAKLGPQTGEPKFACYDVHAGMPGTLTTCSSHGGPACYNCDLISPALVRSCGIQSIGTRWSVSASLSTPCASATTTLRSYLSSSKCSTANKSGGTCSVKTYRCSSRKSSGTKTVSCSSSKARLTFRSKA